MNIVPCASGFQKGKSIASLPFYGTGLLVLKVTVNSALVSPTTWLLDEIITDDNAPRVATRTMESVYSSNILFEASKVNI